MTFLDDAISPAEAVDILGKKGIRVSERTLRARAREIGAYRQVGKAIFFMPTDLVVVLQKQISYPLYVLRGEGIWRVQNQLIQEQK